MWCADSASKTAVIETEKGPQMPQRVGRGKTNCHASERITAGRILRCTGITGNMYKRPSMLCTCNKVITVSKALRDRAFDVFKKR